MTAPQLAAHCVKAIMSETKLSGTSVDEVFMGQVLTSGAGQAPARQAAIFGGLPNTVPCTTIGKVCGSGLKAVMLADTSIRAGLNQVVLAGGMENMSLAPHLMEGIRGGLRMGSRNLVDAMIKDGLWDVYHDFHMGNAAEQLNASMGITRQEQDAFAVGSYEKARKSLADGAFQNEIIAIDKVIQDEEPNKSDLAKIPLLKPAFDPKGSVTAANASKINDGAAALILATEDAVNKYNLSPLATIVGQAQSAHAPELFTTAPAVAIEKLLGQCNINKKDIGLWEINEAFASVAIANTRLLNIDPERINVFGGAVALGHPIGASGARILVTLVHGLRRTKQRYGVASLCLGGGEAVAVLIESVA